jgi:peptide/nickel transport system permease protein
MVGLAAVVISGTIGLLVGLLSGYFGGWVDDVAMRLCDVQLSFPTILLALTIMAVLGSGLDKLILVLGLTGWVQYGRIVRSQVLTIKTDEFVLAAQATGERQWRILFQHILPNVWSPVIVIASFTVASNIVAEASLSFLGVGVPPSVPSWGTMLADGREYVGVADWLTLPAGAAISLTVLSINILGDWLRDYLDPRLKNIG